MVDSSGSSEAEGAGTEPAPSKEQDDPADGPGKGGKSRDEAAGRRARSGEQRDEATKQRDQFAERRDRSADRRDQVAEQRDRSAEQRDRSAEERDRSADQRDLAAKQADARQGEKNTEALNSPVLSRREAASDRRQASQDRRAGAKARSNAEDDRDAARTDRGASAMDRDYSSHDDLTGAYLRGLGCVELEREIERARRTEQPLVLAFVDVDGLKAINDSLGHAVGDRVLLEVADALRAKLRSYDLVIRYGGDEFLCAIPGLTMSDAEQRLAPVTTPAAGAPVRWSVTAGLAELCPGDSWEALIARADAALYRERQQ